LDMGVCSARDLGAALRAALRAGAALQPGQDRPQEDRRVRLPDRIRGLGQGADRERESQVAVFDCRQVETPRRPAPVRCADCGQPGRTVDPITVKALLRPEALARLSAPAHRFCPNPSCPVVYFGDGEAFDREQIAVPVFQKEPPGDRTVCYCFAISEADVRREIRETGRSATARRITAHLKAGRCACEIKNPQGSCCLGNVVAVVKALALAELKLRGLESAGSGS
jgi:Zinc binding domain